MLREVVGSLWTRTPQTGPRGEGREPGTPWIPGSLGWRSSLEPAVAGGKGLPAVNSDLDAGPATAYVNGRILTMDEEHPTAAEMIVQGGRVLAVGGPGLATRAAGSLRQVDLSGRTVIPGFVDAHCHL